MLGPRRDNPSQDYRRNVAVLGSGSSREQRGSKIRKNEGRRSVRCNERPRARCGLRLYNIPPHIAFILNISNYLTRSASFTLARRSERDLSARAYAARCDSLACSTIISVSSASGAAPSPPAERAASFFSSGSGALAREARG